MKDSKTGNKNAKETITLNKEFENYWNSMTESDIKSIFPKRLTDQELMEKMKLV